MKRVVTELPTERGTFNFSVLKLKNKELIFLTTKIFNPNNEVFLRIHSECITGDLFHSKKCDCGKQLDSSLKILDKTKNGLLIYLKQEGRGIGLFEKIKTYNIQKTGIDTHQANIRINRKPDEREYSEAIKILNLLKIKKVNLITNNPDKVRAIEKSNIKLNKIIPLKIKPNKINKLYIESKKKKFKHYFKKNDLTKYIGISGISNKMELSLIYNKINPSKNNIIFLGISANKKNLDKLIHLFQYPNKRGFKKILHFSFKETNSPKEDLKKIIKIKNIEGIQLNDLMDWGSVSELIQIVPKKLKLILPINKRNLKILEDNEFIKIIEKKDVNFLIDNSEGKGIKSNLSEYLKYILLLLNKGQNKIAIAGGIGPNNYKTVFDLEDYFKFSFSVDAESQLKTNNKLNINKIKKYIKIFE